MKHEFSVCFAAIQRIEGYDRLIVKWWWLSLPVLALMVLLAVWRLTLITVLWLQKPRSNPNRLFRQLVRLHRLNIKESSLISRLAQKLPNGLSAAILFADPSCWAWKQVEDPSNVEMLEKLYAKIFGFPRDSLRS